MNIQEFKHIIDRFLNGNFSEKEEKILQNFENQMIEKGQSSVFQNETQAKKLRDEIFQVVSKEIKKPIVIWKRVAVAASVLLLIGIGGWAVFFSDSTNEILKEEVFVNQYFTIKTKQDEQRQITLEDGTKIILYSESSLTYPEKFSENIRKISLSGEAFFEVTKNEEKPFVVTTENIETQVLGTSFNIKAYDFQSKIKVTLHSGKVNVCTENQKVTLLPSEQMIYNKSSKEMISKTIDLQDFNQSKKGILQFKETPINEVAEKLEDFYNISMQIEVKNPEKYRISGVFKNETLAVILRQIQFVHSEIFIHKKSDKQFIIK